MILEYSLEPSEPLSHWDLKLVCRARFYLITMLSLSKLLVGLLSKDSECIYFRALCADYSESFP